MSNKAYFIVAITFVIILISGCINNEPKVGGLNVAFRQDIQDNEINSTFEKINFNVNYTWEHNNYNDPHFEGRKVVWVFIYWGTPLASGGKVVHPVPEHMAKKWQSELEAQNGVVQVSLVYNPS